jgi:hypothetical protein
MNDKIELRQKFEDIDISDPSKLKDEDFVKIWVKDCYRWHDRLLTGKYQHYCPEWDYLPIDDTCMEFEVCTCNRKNNDE